MGNPRQELWIFFNILFDTTQLYSYTVMIRLLAHTLSRYTRANNRESPIQFSIMKRYPQSIELFAH